MNNRKPKFVTGFTLLELLVAIAILAILVALAAPNFDDTIKKNRVQATQRDLIRDLAFARSAAVTRNTIVSICSSSDGETCGGENDWNDGWIVFSDGGTAGGATIGNNLLGADEELLRTYDADLGNVISLTNISNVALRALNFSSRGYLNASRNAVANDDEPSFSRYTVCPPDGDEYSSRGVFLDLTGRSIESRDTDGNGVHNLQAGDAGVDISC